MCALCEPQASFALKGNQEEWKVPLEDPFSCQAANGGGGFVKKGSQLFELDPGVLGPMDSEDWKKTRQKKNSRI